MNAMKLLLIAFLSLFTGQVKAVPYAELKELADAIAVNNALFALTYNGENPAIQPYAQKLDSLLTAVGNQGTGFSQNSLPIELQITKENEKAVGDLRTEIRHLVAEVRELAEMALGQFAPNQYPILMTLVSENPGDYYTAINPDFEFSIHNHPLREWMEEIQLQDIGFEEVMASSDPELWNLAKHCPNLKSIQLFGAELTTANLEKLKLSAITRLEVAELSENQLAALPATFNQQNSLKYLSLRRNKIKRLPAGIEKWTALKFLNLKGNQINQEEKDRIQAALPNTLIWF